MELNCKTTWFPGPTLVFFLAWFAAYAQSNTDVDCPDGAYALGIENGDISNNQLTSSSYYDNGFKPWFGRLNRLNEEYWAIATELPQDDWIQVDLLRSFVVTGIITQGGKNGKDQEWIEYLQIQYGSSESDLSYIMEDGNPKTFTANSDYDSAVAITFVQPLTTRYLRILPVSCNAWCSLRFEVSGCAEKIYTTTVQTTVAEMNHQEQSPSTQPIDKISTVLATMSTVSLESTTKQQSPSTLSGDKTSTSLPTVSTENLQLTTHNDVVQLTSSTEVNMESTTKQQSSSTLSGDKTSTSLPTVFTENLQLTTHNDVVQLTSSTEVNLKEQSPSTQSDDETSTALVTMSKANQELNTNDDVVQFTSATEVNYQEQPLSTQANDETEAATLTMSSTEQVYLTNDDDVLQTEVTYIDSLGKSPSTQANDKYSVSQVTLLTDQQELISNGEAVLQTLQTVVTEIDYQEYEQSLSSCVSDEASASPVALSTDQIELTNNDVITLQTAVTETNSQDHQRVPRFLNSSEAIEMLSKLTPGESEEDELEDTDLATIATEFVSIAEIVGDSLWNYSDADQHGVVNLALGVVEFLLQQEKEVWHDIEKDNQHLMSRVNQATEDIVVSYASNLNNYTFESSVIYECETMVVSMDIINSEISEYSFASPISINSSDEFVSYTISKSALEASQVRAVVNIFYQSLEDIVNGDFVEKESKPEIKRNVNTVSKIMSTSLIPPLQVSVDGAIALHFRIDPQLNLSLFDHNKIKFRCSFLDYAHSSDFHTLWSDDGCVVTGRNFTHVNCKCNHTTSFAILMQVVDIEISEADEIALNTLTMIGCVLSITGTFFTCCTFTFLRISSERTLIHFNLALAILLAQTTFLFEDSIPKETVACAAVTMLLYLTNMAVFTWMLIEGVQIYCKLVVVFSTADKTKAYILAGWGLPVVFTAITTALNMDTIGGNDVCWLTYKDNSIWYFVAPALVVIAINSFILVAVTRVILTLSIAHEKDVIKNARTGIKASAMLLPLLGCTWIFGVLSLSSQTVIFQYLFVICNGFQGFGIFLLYCCFNTEVQEAWKRKKEAWTLNRSLSLRSSAQVSPIDSIQIAK